MKKNKKDLKIEFKSEKLLSSHDFRYCFWRIVPSELSWLGRLFNRWNLIKTFDSALIELSDLCDAWEFSKIKETCKTVGDIEKRDQELQDKLLEAIRQKEAAWEDE